MNMMDDPHHISEDLVTVHREGRIAHVVMNRPERRNALNGDLVMRLLTAFDEIRRDGTSRVVILRGEGPAFSAGADLDALRTMQSASPLENAEDSRVLARLYDTIHQFPLPVIARVHGHAIAGGCGLAASCDVAIVARGAKLGFTEVRIGFVPAIVLVFLRRRVGEANLRRLLLSGALIEADEAVRIGLVSEAVPPDELDARIRDLADDLARRTSASAVRLTKQMLATIPSLGHAEALEYAVQMNAFARSTDDCRAGIAAFLDKTDPPWTGE
jgi:methylglutaconyl-CoA hydratase